MSTHLFGLTDRTFSYSHSVGRNEFAGTGFRNPVDMALGADDIVYVINRAYENRPDGVRVTVCTLNEEYVTEFGSYGEGDGQFIWPSSIALDKDENIYISDEWLNRITVFDSNGEFVSKWGEQGSAQGQLDGPAGLAISGSSIYVSDSRNNRVQKFSLDGQFESSFGESGDGSGQFNMPWGIGLDSSGNIYVTDWRNDRIQQFDQSGEWQATFGTPGTAVGQFNRPNSVSVDKDGDIYVSDWLNDRIQVLAPDGRFITQLTGDHMLSQWGKDKMISNPDMIRQRQLAITHSSDFDKNFSHPTAVKVNTDGQVVVLDSTRGRLQIYTKNTEPVLI
tara:strand:- start:31 stop:1032 length:1002 start_codon:yes stop_codon:yes gene_type:complete